MPEDLVKRLQIKPGQTVLVLNAPDSFANMLSGGHPGELVASGQTASSTFDVVHLFVANSSELASLFETAVRALKNDDALFWIAYPKKGSGIETDLTRDEGWSLVFGSGWQPVRSIAIDDVWTGLRFKRAVQQTEREIIDAQYAGAKAGLRPIYARLVEILTQLGGDVRFEARQSYVAARRSKHFAAIQPTTRTRLDVALKLRGTPFGARFQQNSGVGGGALTHKVAIASLDEIDDELVGYLRAAYEQNA